MAYLFNGLFFQWIALQCPLLGLVLVVFFEHLVLTLFQAAHFLPLSCPLLHVITWFFLISRVFVVWYAASPLPQNKGFQK